MKKLFLTSTVISGFSFIVSLVLYLIFKNSVLLSVCITLGTFFYHLFMRLCVGTAVNCIMKNHADPERFPYSPLPFEKKLYKLLHVRKWKGKMPTYDPSLFSRESHTYEEIAGAMCQAETVHTIIVLLSFLPLVAAAFFGAFPVFLITSIVAAGYDLMFVILQRYNRPRVVRVMNAKKS